MVAFIVRRLIGLVIVLFAITVLTFLIFFAIPGVDPTRRSPAATPPRRPSPPSSTSSGSTVRCLSGTR